MINNFDNDLIPIWFLFNIYQLKNGSETRWNLTLEAYICFMIKTDSFLTGMFATICAVLQSVNNGYVKTKMRVSVSVIPDSHIHSVLHASLPLCDWSLFAMYNTAWGQPGQLSWAEFALLLLSLVPYPTIYSSKINWGSAGNQLS